MTATPPRADLRTLAAEPFWAVALPALSANADPRLLDLLAHALEAGVAAVLPEHRRMVLTDAADSLTEDIGWQRQHTDRDPVRVARLLGMEDAQSAIRRLAAAAPPDDLSGAVPAENAPPVSEEAKRRQRASDSVENWRASEGGFHEPDEPTDHIQAAYDAGTHGRTAPPRGQTRRLDVAGDAVPDPMPPRESHKGWFFTEEGLAKHDAELLARQAATPDGPRTRALPSPDAIARRFHETYERLAPDFGYRTREASAKPWDEVPPYNRSLMTAVAAEVRAWLTDATPAADGQDGRDG